MSLEQDWQRYLINEDIERDIFMYIQSLQEIMMILEEALDTENVHLVKQALDSLGKITEDLELDQDESWTNYSEFD